MQRTQRGEADKAPPRTKRRLQRSDAPPAIVSEMIPYGKLYPVKQPKHANETTAKTSPVLPFSFLVQNLRGSKEAPTSAISQTSDL